MRRRLLRQLACALSLMALLLACSESRGGGGATDDAADNKADSKKEPEKKEERTVKAEEERVDTRPPPMAQPVPLWKGGEVTKKVDAASARLHGYVVLDLGEEWTPYIFTERGSKDEERVPHPYRETYLKLARGEFPDNHHGRRARKDKYLELYGIMPTLSVLRERFHKVEKQGCGDEIDLEPLEEFEGFATYRGNSKARWKIKHHNFVQNKVAQLKEKQGVDSVEQLDRSELRRRERHYVNDYKKLHPEIRAVRAAQERLDCMGYFEGKGSYEPGGLDWSTHKALSEFERRNRVYGWGYIGKETLEKLRHTPLELERQAVVRVLTERAMHAAGVLEDGSTARDGEPRTYEGADGQEHPVPNLEKQLREAVVEAFGLQTPESTLDWLDSLGKLAPNEERLVAFEGPTLPEYYDGNMELEAVIYRGDVWYDFPYTNDGGERSQPMNHRPKITIYTKYMGQRIPLARYGTTIGGWRSEMVDGEVMWKYKNSPTGPRVWHEIIAAPVWLPPESTPAGDLMTRVPGKTGRERYRVAYHETGPSYASAYGLVAAYHQKYRPSPDGGITLSGDEGIRTHGSVDYMSIMRRHSHGCHRLHNHLAVRLMSFVLAHRPHERVGEQDVSYKLALEHKGYEYTLHLDKGGYVFELEEPVKVRVLEGRIRGRVKQPIKHAIPKFNDDAGAFILPDGGAVKVNRYGNMTPIELGPPDGGVRDAATGGTLKAKSSGGADGGTGGASGEQTDTQEDG